MKKLEKLTLTKEDYKKALLSGVYEVCFEKKDGTYRVMRCTLVNQLIPRTMKEVLEAPFENQKKKENPNIISVYDLEKNSWRSFRVDSVCIFKELTQQNQ